LRVGDAIHSSILAIARKQGQDPLHAFRPVAGWSTSGSPDTNLSRRWESPYQTGHPGVTPMWTALVELSRRPIARPRDRRRRAWLGDCPTHHRGARRSGRVDQTARSLPNLQRDVATHSAAGLRPPFGRPGERGQL